jgi:hypothetical protein
MAADESAGASDQDARARERAPARDGQGENPNLQLGVEYSLDWPP